MPKHPSTSAHPAPDVVRAPARPNLPGLNNRAVRRLRQVHAVHSLRRVLVSVLAALGMLLATSIAAPAYAETVAPEPAPEPQVLTVASTAEPAAVERDAYTVTAPPPLRWPLGSLKIASGYGPRDSPCGACSSFHEGIDFDPGYGATVYAIAAGVVVKAGTTNTASLGTYVVIRHVIDSVTIESVYGHMQTGSMPLSVGQEVAVGQRIGRVGSTGVSTGPHLHFELRRGGSAINPLPWLRARLG